MYRDRKSPALLSVLAVIIFWKCYKPLKINIPEILLTGFFAYLFANNIINGSFWGNDRLYNCLILLLLYFVFKVLYRNDNAILKFVFYGIVISTCLENAVGLAQIFNIIPNSDSQFVLGGLFGNPAAYAGHLSVASPFILTIILNYKEEFASENFYYTLIISLVSAVLLIIISDSRGAWLSFFIGSLVVLNYKCKVYDYVSLYTKSLKAKFLAGIVILIGIVLILFVLYQYKPESAYGRLFVWKVSKQLVLENPTFGNGFAYFGANYGKTQAHYFLNNNASENEIQVADYVTCAYNEFLEMLIESGIIGLLLFGAILYFTLIKRYDENNSKFHIAAKASLIALLVLSMVSYPFRLIPNLLLLVICLFIIFSTGHYKTYTISTYRSPFVITWLIIVFVVVYFNSSNLYGFYHFRKGYEKVLNNNFAME